MECRGREPVLGDGLTADANGFLVVTNKAWAKPEPVITRLRGRTCVCRGRGPLCKFRVSGRLGQREGFCQGSAGSMEPAKL